VTGSPGSPRQTALQPLDEALGTAAMRPMMWMETIKANKTANEVEALVKDGEEEARVEGDSDNSDIEQQEVVQS
jgi:hypothetical protein